MSSMQFNKNGCRLDGIYCFECSGRTLNMDGKDKGCMIKDGARTKLYEFYKCVICNYRCSYDKAYVKRNAIKQKR